MNQTNETLETYLAMPFHISIVQDVSSDGHVGWVASVLELPGCLAQGRSPAEAAERIQDAMPLYLADLIESGDAVPRPAIESAANGKVLLRLPRSLHERLVFEARREGVSLNQVASGALAAAVGWRNPSSG